MGASSELAESLRATPLTYKKVGRKLSANWAMRSAMTMATNSNLNLGEAKSSEGAMRWLLASAPLWAVAGFFLLFLPGLTSSPVMDLQRFLSQVVGMPDPIAFRIALAALQVPISILLGVLVAALQLIVLRDIRSWARQWMLAAAAGGAIAAAIGWVLGSLLPSSSPSPPGASSVWLLILQASLRGILYGALNAALQRWMMRGRAFVPGWFVLTCSFAGGAGAFGAFVLAVSALRSLR